MTTTPTPLSKDTGPLDWRIAIVDKAGRPTPEFQRRWATQRTNNGLIGFVGIGSGMPTDAPSGDGEVYIDISTAPPTLYVADMGAWEVVGVVNFTDLQDVPHTYTASADELVRVKSTTDGLEFASISTVLDTIGPDQGDILYRSATGWIALSPGTAGWILETTGGASNPQWSDISNILDNLGVDQGDVIYRGAAGWTVLSPGTSGDVLTTAGTGADPSWAPASGGGGTPGNPTATASDTAVNGSATTYMRSDAAPAVQIGSSSQFGLFKVDGTTVTESAGVLSASGGGGGDPNYTHNAGVPSGSGTMGLVNTDITNGNLYIATTVTSGSAPTVVQAAYADGIAIDPTPVLGATPTPGNLIIGSLVVVNATVNPGVNGWTYVGNSAVTGATVHVFYRYVQSGDGTTYPTMGNLGGSEAAFVTEITGVNGTWAADFDSLTFDSWVSGTSTTTTSVNTAGADELAIISGWQWTFFGPTPTGNSPFTTVVSGAGGARNQGVQVADSFPTSGTAVQTTIDWNGTPGSGAAISTLLLKGGGSTTVTTWHEIQKMDDPFTTSDNGVVPASPGGTTDFLRADGSWAAPPGTGGAVGANPTATASDTAVNGTATTFLRSDGAPAIQKASSSQFGIVKVDGTTITESGGVISASGGGSGGRGLFDLGTMPALSGFTQIGVGGTVSVVENPGKAISVINSSPPNDSGLFSSGLAMAAPSTPYRVSVFGLSNTLGNNYGSIGAGFRDSSTGKLEFLTILFSITGTSGSYGQFEHEMYSSNTSRSSASALGPAPNLISPGTWFGIEDDGTNYTLSWSQDGANYVPIYTHSKSGGFLSNYDEIYLACQWDENVFGGKPQSTSWLCYDPNGLTRVVG